MIKDTIDLSRRTLRNFGITSSLMVVLLFGLLVPWIRGHGRPYWPWFLAGVLLASGMLTPRVLSPVYRIWMKFGHFMGRVNSAIILSIVFFLVFTPVALIMKLLHRDVLHRKLAPEAESYRIASRPLNMKNFERPF
jgi:hypothetical protein